MNLSVVGGLLLTVLAIVVSTVMDGSSFGALIGPSSFVLVLFAAIGASVVGFELPEVKRLPRVLIQAFKGKAPEPDEVVTTLARFGDIARREGVLAMEARLDEVDDAYLRKGLQLLVDGVDGGEVATVLNIDIAALDERHRVGIGFFKTIGGYAPTMGMLGTVIGLINMLQNLSDPSQLGIGMSLALLTTLYGVLLANLFFLPVAEKLTRLNSAELSYRDIILDGILAIQEGSNPRRLVEHLESYLPAVQRVGYDERMNGAKAPTPIGAAAEEAA